MNVGEQSIADAGACHVEPRGTYRDFGGVQFIDTGVRRALGFEASSVPGKCSVDIDRHCYRSFRPDRLWVDPAIARFFIIDVRVGVVSQQEAGGGMAATYYATRGGLPVDYDVVDGGVKILMLVINRGMKAHRFSAVIEGAILERLKPEARRL